jgi:phenylpyruvate tautomerase
MPLIKVQTSVAAPEKDAAEALLKQLSASLAKHLSKSESYVMTALEPERAMTLGGSTEPVCYVEIKSVGSMSAVQTQAMTADFCQQIGQALDVAGDRIYIEFTDVQGYLWGWNGRTL